jgi:hypothetical protein
MKKAVFWDVAPCRYCLNRRIGGTSVSTCSRWFIARGFSFFCSALKMEAIHSSETSVNTISTQHHIPEDGFLQGIMAISVVDSGTP